MRLVFGLAAALVLLSAHAAYACGTLPSQNPSVIAELFQQDIAKTDTASAIYLATLVETEGGRKQIYLLAPSETIAGERPAERVRTAEREWICEWHPLFYADQDEQLRNGDTVIVRSGVSGVDQIAAIGTPDGKRLLALARARQERESGAERSPQE